MWGKFDAFLMCFFVFWVFFWGGGIWDSEGKSPQEIAGNNFDFKHFKHIILSIHMYHIPSEPPGPEGTREIVGSMTVFHMILTLGENWNLGDGTDGFTLWTQRCCQLSLREFQYIFFWGGISQAVWMKHCSLNIGYVLYSYDIVRNLVHLWIYLSIEVDLSVLVGKPLTLCNEIRLFCSSS